MGTTNQLILDSAINKKKFDLIINIDTEKITPFFNRKVKINKNKEPKEIKDIKENKDIFEITKNEKNIYNSIRDKLKEFDIKYNNTQWLNTLNDNNYNKNSKKLIIDNEDNEANIANTTNNNIIHSISYETIDNYIRTEFENYFKKLFIQLSLLLNIVKNNSIARLLDFPKDYTLSQYILDSKILKKIFKILVPNSNFIEFFLFFTNVKSFEYWLKEHDENLFYLHENIATDKTIIVFNEDGSIYEGEYKNGKPNGHGSMTSNDNKTIYDGEWKNGKKEGIGKLIITDKYNYSGPFENDFFSGTGGVLCDNQGNIYDGDFDKGKFNGYGHYKMANGDTYIGEFKDGLFNGKGQYNDKDGNLFDGEFKNGKKEGRGMLIKSNGEKIEGMFSNDLFVEK